MKYDDFGDRMKAYERVYTSTRIPSTDILCVRIDGKGFSKYTKGFEKPFDARMTAVMQKTTLDLVKASNADLGYTQSDEISLFYSLYGSNASEHIFGGKVSKINSILASMAAAHFNYNIGVGFMGSPTKLAYFDCRAFGVPSLMEASNVLLWRIQDARKNSVSAMFRWTLGHKNMQNLDQLQMISKMKEEGIFWDDLKDEWKYGSVAVRETYELTTENGNVTRSRVVVRPTGYFGALSAEQRENFLERYEA